MTTTNAPPFTVQAPDGEVELRHFPAPGDGAHAALFVGGAGGGWDSPANALYPAMCARLPVEGISCLRVRFRDPTDLTLATTDVLVGMRFLVERGAVRVALVGHSFGAAVVIRAAAASPEARAVVCLAPQSYGAEAVKLLRPQTRLLVVHGLADEILPPVCARQIDDWAHEPKHLELLPGNGHCLEESADAVHEMVHDFVVDALASAK